MTDYTFAPPPIISLPVQDSESRFPVNRVFCVGRNYHAHAAEMGKPVNKAVDRPFYFNKSSTTVISSGATIPYPAETTDYQYEMELVVAIGKPGFRVKAEDAHDLVFGYACGLDMTRRDLQLAARDKGRPWDLGKDFEQSAVVSPILPMKGKIVSRGRIQLAVNGSVKQDSDVERLIWDVREIVEDLSRFYHLVPGDLIFTGTPEGVGPVIPGDRIVGSIEGVGTIDLAVSG